MRIFSARIKPINMSILQILYRDFIEPFTEPIFGKNIILQDALKKNVFS